MAHILHIYPNTSWYYSLFTSTDDTNILEDIKKITSSNRVIGPIQIGKEFQSSTLTNFGIPKQAEPALEYIYVLYTYSPFSSNKSPDQLNILGDKFVTLAFNKRKWGRVFGTITVVKFDSSFQLIDISFDDFFSVYMSYSKSKPAKKRIKIRNFISCLFSKIQDRLNIT